MIDRHTDRYRERERDRRMEIDHTETARSNLIHVSMKNIRMQQKTFTCHLQRGGKQVLIFITALNSVFFDTNVSDVYDEHASRV